MNAQRLNDICKNIRIAENSDIDNIKQLTVDYPFYHLPYVVLAKYYYDTSHYKFEDMLRQAAMRVKDRRQLYHYIHGNNETSQSAVDPDSLKYEEKLDDASVITPETIGVMPPETAELPGNQEILPEVPATEDADVTHKAGLEDFLEDFGKQDQEEEKPEEFVFEGRHDGISAEDIQVDDRDIIGEEIATEFSFTHAFKPEQQDTEQDIRQVEPEEEYVEETENVADTGINTLAYPKNLSEHLRKNPVYSIEAAVKDQSENEELSPEKDFFAWLKHPHYVRTEKNAIEEETQTGPTDAKIDLIEKFISINPQITRPKKEFFNPENMAKKSELVDLEYVTETLATIYYEQGNAELAVRAYEKLSLQNPSKQAYFADLIEKIRKDKK